MFQTLSEVNYHNYWIEDIEVFEFRTLLPDIYSNIKFNYDPPNSAVCLYHEFVRKFVTAASLP